MHKRKLAFRDGVFLALFLIMLALTFALVLAADAMRAQRQRIQALQAQLRLSQTALKVQMRRWMGVNDADTPGD